MAKLLIVGCGAIGQELAAKLAKAGHDVTGLKRTVPTLAPENFRYVSADISRPQDLKCLGSDFEHVFFIVSAGRRDEGSYRAIYEIGIDNLLERFAQAGTNAPWTFVSSTSVYGQNQGEWVDETSPTLPNNTTSRLIVVAEQKLMVHSPHNISVRFSGIYGPGREHLLRMAQQSPEIQRHPPYYTNRIHQRDCVAVLAFLLECRLQGKALDQCYLASDDNPATMWDVVTWLAGQLHCRPPIAKVVDNAAEMNKRCRNDRIKQLGYRFIYPDYQAGYSELLNAQPGQDWYSLNNNRQDAVS